MITNKKNIEGMLRSAQDKKTNAIERINQAIEKVTQEQRPVTFAEMAKIANVSTAWLYRQTLIRQRIEQLRITNRFEKKKHIAPSKTENNIIISLKQKILKLKTENNELRKQLEIIYGQLYTKNTDPCSNV